MNIRKISALLVLLLSGVLPLVAQTLDFVNADANHINMNGDNWNRLRTELADVKKLPNEKFQILQIGDSHIQADFSASVVRRTLQSVFGDGGRGCIAALRMVGTNQPVDYKMYADTVATTRARLLSKDWPCGMGMTGVAASFDKPERKLHISLDATCGGFTSFTLLHAKGAGYASAMVADSIMLGNPVTEYATHYDLNKRVDSVTVATSFDSPFYGAYLLNSKPGLVLNAIGNNGACFGHYNKIPAFAEQTKVFTPSLIILSMGTNEAFGNETADDIYADIDRLVKTLRDANPKAKFLLTTPMECQKKVTRTVQKRIRVRKRKYRNVKSKVTAFVINRRIEEVRNVILRYGKDKRIPVWDLYEIAGGEGASDKWLANGLMNPRDHVHCLQSGYELRGSLLSDALLEQIANKK